MNWPNVRLGEVVKHRSQFILIDDLITYKRCRVQLHAQGVVLRDRVQGSDIKTKKQQVCQAGELLVAEIDAKHGGYGIVPPDLEGAIVSSHYFLFSINKESILPDFLNFFIKTPKFFEQVAAQGSTNYAAIRPGHVLNYIVPLPPLDVQKRIVARITHVINKLAKAADLAGDIEYGSQAILNSAFHQIASNSSYKPMREVAPLIRRAVTPVSGTLYHELGIRSFGKGTFHKPPLEATAVGTKKLYEIRQNDLVFSNVFAWEGAIAVAAPEDSGRVGSHRFITCVPVPGVATAKFLNFYFSTPEGLEKIGVASPGGAGRNRTLGLEALARLEVPVPRYDEQEWFTKLIEKQKVFSAARSQLAKERKALLPSVLDRAFRGEL